MSPIRTRMDSILPEIEKKNDSIFKSLSHNEYLMNELEYKFEHDINQKLITEVRVNDGISELKRAFEDSYQHSTRSFSKLNDLEINDTLDSDEVSVFSQDKEIQNEINEEKFDELNVNLEQLKLKLRDANDENIYQEKKNKELQKNMELKDQRLSEFQKEIFQLQKKISTLQTEKIENENLLLKKQINEITQRKNEAVQTYEDQIINYKYDLNFLFVC
ncbi:unnamed protein product [Brachionus calyciflorus]|uniref:Uncharacterized protein n=1 Tax=Brachionus calyciflorus TaxID=104777 RepID=A0A814B523_9BILA|nr:unnamed protein product [Brachionus calyciflorus]